eukprot:1027142-Prymnesium_polylepis.1
MYAEPSRAARVVQLHRLKRRGGMAWCSSPAGAGWPVWGSVWAMHMIVVRGHVLAGGDAAFEQARSAAAARRRWGCKGHDSAAWALACRGQWSRFAAPLVRTRRWVARAFGWLWYLRAQARCRRAVGSGRAASN